MTNETTMAATEPAYRKLPPVREPLRYDVTIASNCYSTEQIPAAEREVILLLALLKHIHPKTVAVNEREDELTGELTIMGLPAPVLTHMPLSHLTVDGGARLTVRFTKEIFANEVHVSARAVYPSGLEGVTSDTSLAMVDRTPLRQLIKYGQAVEFTDLWDMLTCYHTDRKVNAARAISRLSEAVRWQLAGQILKEAGDAQP